MSECKCSECSECKCKKSPWYYICDTVQVFLIIGLIVLCCTSAGNKITNYYFPTENTSQGVSE